MKPDHFISTERGSIIYWIFIAIALFAALSFTISNISRTGSNQMGELDRLQATDIMQYAAAVQRGIRTMRIEGVDESDLCFHADQWGHTDYEFIPECNDNDNRVFHPAGGSIKFQESVDEWYDNTVSLTEGKSWIISGHYEVENVGTDGGSANSEAANVELLLITAPVKDTVCEAINELLGHTPGTPPAAPADTHTDLRGNKFAGAYSGETGSKIGDLGRERCVNVPAATPFNLYYKVILAR